MGQSYRHVLVVGSVSFSPSSLVPSVFPPEMEKYIELDERQAQQQGSETPTGRITAAFSTTDHNTGGRCFRDRMCSSFSLLVVRHDSIRPGAVFI